MQPTQHTLPTPYPVGPVHCYTTEINDQLILVDTGPPTDETKQYLEERGIKVVQAKTRDAVTEFNQLQKEYARIVAALHLTC